MRSTKRPAKLTTIAIMQQDNEKKGRLPLTIESIGYMCHIFTPRDEICAYFRITPAKLEQMVQFQGYVDWKDFVLCFEAEGAIKLRQTYYKKAVKGDTKALERMAVEKLGFGRVSDRMNENSSPNLTALPTHVLMALLGHTEEDTMKTIEGEVKCREITDKTDTE